MKLFNRNPILVVLMILSCVPIPALGQRRPSKPRPTSPAIAVKGPCTLTKELLTGTEWRLYSKSFQIVRAAGIAIRLNPDGTVTCDDIGWVAKWQLEPDGKVNLLEPDGTIAFAFRFDADACVLTTLDCGDATTQASAMGSRGTNFDAYFAKACPERFGKTSR